MQIQIKDSMSNNVMSLDINDDDTIQVIKEKIGGLKNIDPTQINLVFNGKNLLANQTAKDYDIKEGCILHQILHLKEGY